MLCYVTNISHSQKMAILRHFQRFHALSKKVLHLQQFHFVHFWYKKQISYKNTISLISISHNTITTQILYHLSHIIINNN